MTFEDRFEIHELVARYNFAADDGDAEAWADTFTADGVLDGLVGEIKGRDALVTFLNDLHENPVHEHLWGDQHWVNNLLVTEAEGGARLRAMHILVKPTSQTESINGGEVLAVSNYDDLVVRTSDGWRFQRRTCRPHRRSR